MAKLLYLGEIGYRNAGDEVMWDIFKQEARRFIPNELSLLEACRQEYAHISGYDIIVLGGGSLLAPSYISLLSKAMELNKSIYIWGSGIDKIAGRSGLDSLLNKKQLPANFVDPNIVNQLNKIISYSRYTAVRGPLSHRFLQSIGVNTAKVQISGDPAFLLQPGDRAKGLFTQYFDPQEAVVGINWGTANNQIFGGKEDIVEDQLAAAAKLLIHKGYSILLYNVWPEDIPASKRLLTKINRPGKVKLADTVYPYQLMALIQKCRFTINLKLHAAIFSAVMQVPFISLGYRFKMFDFAASISMLPFVIPTDNPAVNFEILRLSQDIEKNHATLVRTLKKEINKYAGRLSAAFFVNTLREELRNGHP
ncbi:polysaccharide pyruvyl transferase family protein [Paenibacillus chondroitinus]|uniref:Polysaccharide pyruvyl transferase family protein n=1 Tax=Paenibacillus chondroitinus TaxID=59842 RepID=A0ABU6D6E7_9BACL|nr:MULTISPECIES: polysaccharide pyruvyl transferase family protein [Paenibacillus]MCY9660116.1 polysaccharide pyruvyl transferase family protein [Paenibacillus anseongense]MEB4793025.1 polysaccharide pyruvyl transferase family protein [Paenibacillus chondroitinus]